MSSKDRPIILMRRESPNAEDFDDAMVKAMIALEGLPVTVCLTSIDNYRMGLHSQINVEGNLEKSNAPGVASVVMTEGAYAHFTIKDIQTLIVYPEEEVINQEGIQAIIYIQFQSCEENEYTQVQWHNRLAEHFN